MSLKFRNFFILRSPLLPYRVIYNLTPQVLNELFSDPVLQEALFIASPDLHSTLYEWLKVENPTTKAHHKITISLCKYALRMAYRCTPFGLFSGISLGHWEEKTVGTLAPISDYERHSRLDMGVLNSLIYKLESTSSISNILFYYPNNTIYNTGNRLRYVEYEIISGNKKHSLVDVANSPLLTSLLEAAEKGTLKYELELVLQRQGIPNQEAKSFIDHLISNQLLVSELNSTITGINHLSRLAKKLGQRGAFCEASELEQLGSLIRDLNHHRLGVDKKGYSFIEAKIKDWGVSWQSNRLLQVDMRKPVQKLTLNPLVQDELSRVIDLLARINIYNEGEKLKSFRNAFVEQFDRQEVSLVKVLDAELGIGYPVGQYSTNDNNPLLDDLLLAGRQETKATYGWSDWVAFLFDQYTGALRSGSTSIELKWDVLQPILEQYDVNLPHSLYALGTLLASSQEDLDEGDFTLLHQVSAGPSAANLLGRFCHMDPMLTESLQVALRDEEERHPEAIFAEVVHSDQFRTGNIASRPILRGYEIPIVTQASVAHENTIFLDDLLVSVVADRVVLRSRKLNKEVIPRMSAAHAYYRDSLPAYHFLCDVQYQGTQRSLSWDWGILRNADFLPQVRYGRSILAPARWKLKESTLIHIKNCVQSQLITTIKDIRSQQQIPQWVVVIESDNKLPLDLENSLHLDVLQSLIFSKTELILEESLLNHKTQWVSGPEGNFTNEFVWPISVLGDPILSPFSSKQGKQIDWNTRNLILGSEWLYIKLYCGSKTADQLLTDLLAPLAHRLTCDNIIDKWFFIRYADPEPHLRIRFHGKEKFYSEVIAELELALRSYYTQGLLKGLKIDIYEREIERYGAEDIEATEDLFYHDSIAVVGILNLLGETSGDQLRWLLGLRGIDILLDDFGYTLLEKHALLDKLQMDFKHEFKATSTQARKVLASKFRKEVKQIEIVMQTTYDATHPMAKAFHLLDTRSYNSKSAINNLRANWNNSLSANEQQRRLSDYLHMFLNRIFRSNSRRHEMVVYDLLSRYYNSLIARNARQ
ncbi:lantibiotic dehydratase [Hymenobacter rubripertinctus]|uniref:Lantibiotic dehydratase n=1 Tax=Hymenobacter rubripertinctus TaxID=2029981 RepID=A0A418QL94_9BACT|nr:lantibiotic dehydratase [Hymenobacter rubripertinctus]RIY05911.1 hypothetical protein D0T11_19670 [Hymenobacter rubripertinctus]